MKKHIIALSALLALLILFTAPRFAKRTKYEKDHRIYSVAFDIADVFESEDALALLKSYKESGATVAVIKERGDIFLKAELDMATKAGLTPALLLCPDGEKKGRYIETLRKNVEDYGVKYFIIKNSPNENSSELTEKICEIIDKYNITVVLSENISQLSNEKPEGFSSYLESGNVMRCYETLEKSYASDKDYPSIFYQMLNSAIDRNTEFLLVNQLGDSEFFLKNAQRTQKCIKLFCERMDSLGYIKDAAPNLSGYENSAFTFASVAAISAVLLLLLYMFLTGKGFPAYFYALIPAGFGVSFVMPESLLLLYPTAFSALIPCFCFALCLFILKSNIKWRRSICFISGSIALLILNMCHSALLSGAQFYMNNLIFRGVMVTLVVPLIFAAAVYFVQFKPNFKSLSAKHIALGIIILLLGAVYLIRSGNSSISEFERLLRDKIVWLTTARPRTKEFLIGWPCFLIFTLAGRKGGILKFLSYIGAALLFSSVTNSFCHVFCDAAIIYTRTFNGFLFSLPLLLIIFLIYKKTEKSN